MNIMIYTLCAINCFGMAALNINRYFLNAGLANLLAASFCISSGVYCLGLLYKVRMNDFS